MVNPISSAPPIFEPRRTLKVVCIGAGASGLLLAYKLQRHFDNLELVVYEKNPEVSGTWYENRYPGYVFVQFIGAETIGFVVQDIPGLSLRI